MNPRPSISHRLTRPFSRVTSSGFFLPQIDGLRFVAILAVFLFHLGIFVKAKSPVLPGAGWADALLGHVIDKGDLGVQLFFVISGFILALPFAAHFLEGRPPGRLGSYYLRRLTRLEPPYFINLALIVTLLVFVNHQPAGELLPDLFASAGYVSYLTMGHPSLINSVAWSLEVEVQFYLLAPVLSLVFCIGSASARRATIAVAMLAGVILQQGLGFTEKTLLGNLQYFMAGFFLCDLYLSRWKRNLSARWGWDLGALLAWIAMGAAHRLGAAWAWSLPVLILIAYCGAFRGAIFAKVLGNPWPATIGGMCYTIYLYHYFLISLAGRFTAHWLPTASYPLAVLVQFFLITPIVLAGCGVLFVIFERPFMNPEWPARMGIVQRKKLRCYSSREQGGGMKTSRFSDTALLFNLATDVEHPILGFSTQWIRELAARVGSIDVITMRAGVIDVPSNVRVHSVGKEHGYSEPRRVLEFYRHLFRILRTQRIDGCFSHMMPPFSVLGGPILRARRIPLVTWYAHPNLTLWVRLAHFFSNRMVTSLPHAYPYRKDKLSVIGQGIDTALFAPSPNAVASDDLVLCVGRISRVKNHPTLLRAAAFLRIPFRLVILGATAGADDEIYARELKQLASELGLEDSVTFASPVPRGELPEHYRRCAVHVNLTPAGFGDKVAWEAMSCGRPCLVANDDFRETVGCYEKELLFRGGDPTDLARKLRSLLNRTSAQRDEIGLYLREQVERLHSLPRLATRVLDELQPLRPNRAPAFPQRVTPEEECPC